MCAKDNRRPGPTTEKKYWLAWIYAGDPRRYQREAKFDRNKPNKAGRRRVVRNFGFSRLEKPSKEKNSFLRSVVYRRKPTQRSEGGAVPSPKYQKKQTLRGAELLLTEKTFERPL